MLQLAIVAHTCAPPARLCACAHKMHLRGAAMQQRSACHNPCKGKLLVFHAAVHAPLRGAAVLGWRHVARQAAAAQPEPQPEPREQLQGQSTHGDEALPVVEASNVLEEGEDLAAVAAGVLPLLPDAVVSQARTVYTALTAMYGVLVSCAALSSVVVHSAAALQSRLQSEGPFSVDLS